MAFAFDTLSYAKRLREAGVPVGQAEAHAEAARDFIVPASISTFELLASKSDLPATDVDLKGAVDRMTQQITVRVGGIIIASFIFYALAVLGFFAK